jgi:2-aminomuconate deaminase
MSTQAIILDQRAAALAHYPHARVVQQPGGRLVFVSGVSSRRPQKEGAAPSWEGVEVAADGTVKKDITAQSDAVLKNIDAILGALGAGLKDTTDITVFLVDMADYAGMNAAWNRHFPDPAAAPARTTVAVHQLPHPNLLVEMKATAWVNQ